MDKRFDAVIEKISSAGRILVISHQNPEGDAVGSLLGLALALQGAGKDVTPYLEDLVPALFGFLPGAGSVVHTLANESPFDVTIAVDCGQKERLGAEFVDFDGAGAIINIDHHTTNTGFGDINVVEPGASSAGEMVYQLLKAFPLEITKDVALNLYVAIHTDTGSFRYSSATPEAFEAAGELVSLGIDPWDVATRLYENHPAQRYMLLGMALSTLSVEDGAKAKVAFMEVSLDMLNRAGADAALTEGFVNYPRGVEGVEVGVFLRELGPGHYKVSLRSKGGIDVARIAESFGGGGHRNAAGFAIKGEAAEVKRIIVEAARASAEGV